jgi:hypothetical protein
MAKSPLIGDGVRTSVGTHWEGCYKAHHNCAVARVERLAARVKELERLTNFEILNDALENAEAENKRLLDQRDNLAMMLRRMMASADGGFYKGARIHLWTQAYELLARLGLGGSPLRTKEASDE